MNDYKYNYISVYLNLFVSRQEKTCEKILNCSLANAPTFLNLKLSRGGAASDCGLLCCDTAFLVRGYHIVWRNLLLV
jgi:hypothetical protein